MKAFASGFVDLVKDALEHLYDPLHLEEHPLARMLLPERLPPGVSRVEALRQVLLDSIDRLDASVPSGSRQDRLHKILELRYVEALPYREVMAELALSQPQYHREQRRAVVTLASMLHEIVEGLSQEQAGLGAGITGAPAASAQQALPQAGLTQPFTEIDAAIHQGETVVDLCDLADGVIEMLRPIAANRGVVLIQERPTRPVLMRGSRTAIRQLLISLIGWLLDGVGGGQLVLSSRMANADVVLDIVRDGMRRDGAREDVEAREGLEDAERLLQSLGGVLRVSRGLDHTAATVRLPASHRLVLVIDDNPDIVQLISRFVADQGYAVVAAENVPEGLDLARSIMPDVIILDIMIPEKDGWDALQALKHDPATQDIPILVCTVLRESQLALALGAAEFIRKPLTVPCLLDALARWAHRSPLTARGSRAQSAPL